MKTIVTSVGAIVLTIAVAGMALAAGEQSVGNPDQQTQMHNGSSGSKTPVDTDNQVSTNKSGQQHARHTANKKQHQGMTMDKSGQMEQEQTDTHQTMEGAPRQNMNNMKMHGMHMGDSNYRGSGCM